jgi:hypothetical protein
MAVRVFCNAPQQLLKEIRAAIRNGSVETWLLDSDGDFTHAPQQWHQKAWFRARVESGKLVFNILGPKGQKMTTAVYAVYHGRFIEMLLTHFDRKFEHTSATAQVVDGDWIG